MNARSQRARLTLPCRVKALEAGLWQRTDGSFIELRQMPDGHLVNALLQALERAEPVGITRPLADEVKRRRIEALAYAAAADRT